MDPVVSEHVASRQFLPYNVAVIAFMGFASVAMGCSASIIGTTLAQPTFLEYFELTTRQDSTSLISTMNGLFQAGAFVGACLINPVADHWGRKWAITLPALLVILSGALLAASVNIAMFLAFRFVAGVGSWMLLGTIPIWMTEVAPPKNRGALVNIHGACLLFGYAYACWVGYGFYFVDHPDAWRATFAFQCLPAIIILMGMPLLPESPRYLVKSGKHDEARTVLARLHAPQEARFEFAQIEAQLQVDALLPNTWKSLTFSQLCLDEVQWVWYPELFPSHLRGKGVTIGLATVALMNIMWLQAAATAFENIGWKFFLCFIIPAYLFAIVCFFFFPDTRGMALEEIGALFGDESEVYRGPVEELQIPFSEPKAEHTRKEAV